MSSARAASARPLRLGIAVVDHGAGERLVELLHARDVVEREAEHVAREPDRERRGELLDELALAARRELAEQRVDVAVHRLGEALAHGTHPERLVERPALPRVLARRRSSASSRRATRARGSARPTTVKSSPRPSSSRASSCEVTSQPPSAGTHEIGSKSRRRSSARDAAVELEIGELDARRRSGSARCARRLSASSSTICGTSGSIAPMLPRGALDDGGDGARVRDLREVAGARDDRHAARAAPLPRAARSRPAPSCRAGRTRPSRARARARGRRARGPGCRCRPSSRARPRCRPPRSGRRQRSSSRLSMRT